MIGLVVTILALGRAEGFLGWRGSTCRALMPSRASAVSPGILGSLTEAPEAELSAAVESAYESIGQDEMAELAKRASDGEGSWPRVLAAVEAETHRRMSAAKERLQALLEAGEINELDRRLVRMVKAGGVDAAFLTVLNTNLKEVRSVRSNWCPCARVVCCSGQGVAKRARENKRRLWVNAANKL